MPEGLLASLARYLPSPPKGANFGTTSSFEDAEMPLSGLDKAVAAVGSGVAQTVATPGKLMAQNPWPEGTEQWEWYEDQRRNAATKWAPEMALNTLGTGGIAGVPLRGGEVALGSGAVRGIKSGAMSSQLEIASLEELKKHLAGGEPLFVRYSSGPKQDMKHGARSTDHQTGEVHDGLSSVQLNADMSDGELVRYLRDYASGGEPHVYAGKIRGVDSDGAPTIEPTKYIGNLSPALKAFIGDETVPQRIDLQQMISRLRGSTAAENLTPFQRNMLQEWESKLTEFRWPTKV